MKTYAVLTSALSLFISADLYAATKVRILWEGSAEAIHYEVQVAPDKSFKNEVKTKIVKVPNHVLEIPSLTWSLRIRAVFSDKTASAWLQPQFKEFGKPKLPGRITIPKEKAGKTELFFAAGEISTQRLIYRVKITSQDRATLYDGLISESKFRLPLLPAGLHHIEVETLGNPAEGSLHTEGQSIAEAEIEVESDREDGFSENNKSISSLTSDFRSGLSASANFSYGRHATIRSNQFLSTQALAFQTESGWRFSGEVPIVFSPSFGLGVNPFPIFTLTKKTLSLNITHLALGLNLSKSKSKTFLGPKILAEISGREFILEGSLNILTGFILDLDFSTGYLISDELLVGAFYAFDYESVFLPSPSSALVLGPLLNKKLTTSSYLNLRAGYAIIDSVSHSSKVQTTLGFGVVF